MLLHDEDDECFSIAAQRIIRRYRDEQRQRRLRKQIDASFGISRKECRKHRPSSSASSSSSSILHRRIERLDTSISKKRDSDHFDHFGEAGYLNSDSDNSPIQPRRPHHLFGSQETHDSHQHDRPGSATSISDCSDLVLPSIETDETTSMAVPPEVTIQNLTGTYNLNRSLSDNSQQVLKMQNIGFVIRQAVAYSTVTVTLQQYADSEGRHHLDQEQLSTGGIKNFEDRIMDWVETQKWNWIWGKVNGKSRYTTLAEIEDPYLREGWAQDCVDGQVVEGYVEGVADGWTARQVWGFAEIDGQRRHVRRIHATRPGYKDQRIRMVYDWKGPANATT